MSKLIYLELDFVINSLRMSIDSTDYVFMQIAWLVDLVIASYFKKCPNIVKDFKPDTTYEITSRSIKLVKYKKVWPKLYKCRNYICHKGLFASVSELKSLSECSNEVVAIAKSVGADINIKMLNNFVEKYCV